MREIRRCADQRVVPRGRFLVRLVIKHNMCKSEGVMFNLELVIAARYPGQQSELNLEAWFDTYDRVIEGLPRKKMLCPSDLYEELMKSLKKK